jgi:hypothetical protein
MDGWMDGWRDTIEILRVEPSQKLKLSKKALERVG